MNTRREYNVSFSNAMEYFGNHQRASVHNDRRHIRSQLFSYRPNEKWPRRNSCFDVNDDRVKWTEHIDIMCVGLYDNIDMLSAVHH